MDEVNGNTVFRVMSWNNLASKLTDKSAFPFATDKSLDWKYRESLIKKYIQDSNADFLCFVEVDNIDKYINEIFGENTKYSFNYLLSSNLKQGKLIAFDKYKYRLDYSHNINLPNENSEERHQSILIDKFTNIKTNKTLILLCVHLKSKKKFEDLRIVQVQYLLDYMKKSEIINKANNFIICGDFNAEPTYKSINMMDNSEFNLKSVFQNKNNQLNNYIEYTTYKIRDQLEKRIIDYIYYYDNGKLKVKSQKIANPEIESNAGLPNEKFPSDHLYLLADFEVMN